MDLYLLIACNDYGYLFFSRINNILEALINIIGINLLEYGFARQSWHIRSIILWVNYDLLNGSVLGLHGILFVLITYICQRFFYQFRVSPIWQQSVILFFLFFIFKMVLSFDFFSLRAGLNVSDSFYVLNSLLFALVSSLFWTPTFFLLRELRRRKVKL